MAAALDRLTAHQQRQRQRNNARPAGNRYLIFRPSRRQQLPKGSQLIDKLQQNRQLHNFYHPDTLQQALGYRHMVDFIHGRLSWEETVRTLKRDHRHYAKRQYTWFNKVEDIHWLTPDQSREAADLVERFLNAT